MNLYRKESKKGNAILSIFFNPFRVIAVIFVFLLIVILTYLIVVGFLNNLFFRDSNIFVQNSSSSNKEFLIAKINDLEELSTAEYLIDKEIATTVDFNQLELPGGISFDRQKTQIADISGTVKAGLDLGDVTTDDIEIEGDKITIDIPSTKIISVDVDDEKTVLKKDSNSLIISIENLYPQRKLEFENQIRAEIASEAKVQIRDAACQKGILEKSQENANELIEKLYLDSGFDEVEIVSKEVESC